MHSILALLLLALVAVLPLNSFAGITIHYEGRAKNVGSVEGILQIVRKEAERNGWSVSDASSKESVLTRVINEKDVPYQGPVRGLVIRPHQNCEPFFVQFDANLFMQDFVKTQFASPETHTALVQLLKKIRPLMQTLSVDDEGEYWETGDKNKLQAHFQKVNSLITEIKKSKPGLKGPVSLPNGRIVDLME